MHYKASARCMNVNALKQTMPMSSVLNNKFLIFSKSTRTLWRCVVQKVQQSTTLIPQLRLAGGHCIIGRNTLQVDLLRHVVLEIFHALPCSNYTSHSGGMNYAFEHSNTMGPFV